MQKREFKAGTLFVCDTDKKRGVYCCPAACWPVLNCRFNPTLLPHNVEVTPVTHCESCWTSCDISISCSTSPFDELPLSVANAESSPETEIVPNINADAMKTANIPTLWFFVILLMVIRIHNSI